LHVQSEPGAGAEFHIYLRAADVAQNKPQDHFSGATPSGHGETILVVDDEAAVCLVTQRSLESHGYRVLTARNGREAVAVFAKNGENVRLVLTDMMMPDMDGAATARALRKLYPKVPVIGTSGLEGTREAAESVGAEFQGFLHKPFKADKLLRVVNEVLRK
jgi:CheY-like chemotaxis protein